MCTFLPLARQSTSPGVCASHRQCRLDGLVCIEVQHGDYFGEDDIEPLDDDLGRAG